MLKGYHQQTALSSLEGWLRCGVVHMGDKAQTMGWAAGPELRLALLADFGRSSFTMSIVSCATLLMSSVDSKPA